LGTKTAEKMQEKCLLSSPTPHEASHERMRWISTRVGFRSFQIHRFFFLITGFRKKIQLLFIRKSNNTIRLDRKECMREVKVNVMEEEV